MLQFRLGGGRTSCDVVRKVCSMYAENITLTRTTLRLSTKFLTVILTQEDGPV